MIKFSQILAPLFAAALLLPVQAKAADEVFELNFQSAYAGPHVLNVKGFQPWIEEMNAKSNGRLIIHFFMANALVKTNDVVPSLLNGNLDMAGGSVSYQDTLFPYSQVFQLPHLTKNSVQGSKLYWKIYENVPEINKELNDKMKLLTLWASDRTAFFSTGKPILAPADLKGKRVLIWNGGQVDQIKAWGGVPVQISSGDTYLSLQRGMGDVFFGPLPMGVAYKLMEISKEITILPATVIYGSMWINKDLWNDLPADLQKLLDESTGKVQNEQFGQLLLDATNKDIETMRAAGCKVHELNEAQYQAFQDADRDVTMKFWNENLARLGVKDPAALIKQIYELSEATE